MCIKRAVSCEKIIWQLKRRCLLNRKRVKKRFMIETCEKSLICVIVPSKQNNKFERRDRKQKKWENWTLCKSVIKSQPRRTCAHNSILSCEGGKKQFNLSCFNFLLLLSLCIWSAVKTRSSTIGLSRSKLYKRTPVALE